jgi:single-strand DNA-binding protein
MPYLNEHIVMGHIGQEPEVRYTSGGRAYAHFSVATTEKWKDKDSGEPRERTDWHNVVVWGKGAEFISEYVGKGDLVMVKAPSRTRKWQDKDGNDRYTTEIVCTRFEHFSLLHSKNEKQSSSGQSQQAASGQQDGFDDDIPF